MAKIRRANRYDRALEVYEKAINLDAEDAVAWEGKARVLYRLNMYQDALTAYEKATDLNPKNPKAWCDKGSVLGTLKKYNEALLSFDTAISLSPRSSVAWQGRGTALTYLSRYKEALSAYEKALDLIVKEGKWLWWSIGKAKERKWLWWGIGKSLWQLQRYEEALSAFERAIIIGSKKDPGPWCGKGAALSSLGKHEEALAAYKKATKLNPSYLLGWKGYVHQLVYLGRYLEAHASLDELVKTDSELEPVAEKARTIIVRHQRRRQMLDSVSDAVVLTKELLQLFDTIVNGVGED